MSLQTISQNWAAGPLVLADAARVGLRSSAITTTGGASTSARTTTGRSPQASISKITGVKAQAFSFARRAGRSSE